MRTVLLQMRTHEMLEERREARRPKSTVLQTKQKNVTDPVLQTTDGTKALTAPLVNFDGNNDNGSLLMTLTERLALHNMFRHTIRHIWCMIKQERY